MGLPESQGRLLRELHGRSQRGPTRVPFTVTPGAPGADVRFDGEAAPLGGVSMDDLRGLADRGFVDLAPAPGGGLRGSVTSAGADYATANLKPMAGG